MWLHNPKHNRTLVIHTSNVKQKLEEGWTQATEAQIKCKLGIKDEPAPKVEAPKEEVVEEKKVEAPKKKRVRRTKAQIEADNKSK